MSRTKYRHRVEILRRPEGTESKGGYGADEYEKIGETSCEVRDESPAEFAAAESAGIEHVRTFTMRTREIRADDLLVWDGQAHAVQRNDGVKHLGREIRVRASTFKSRYSVKGENQSEAAHGTD